ncbi:MAG TPA: NAD(P)H-dependent oxidoreductase [Bacteriovoracaceae bacterium]|nr:NAD(P)H-dependent oxidoreductase [Bacteriovoracaceae bacterium]
MSFQILTLVGGISRGSLNKKLFEAVRERAPEGYEILEFDISHLPFFSQDLELEPPDYVTEFKERIRESDAALFITPEYNRSFPGVLKNAIDWGSRPYGQNLWDRKPAGVMGATISNVGTFGAQHHLRQVLAYLNMPVMAQPEFYFQASKAFDEKGKLLDEKTGKYILNYWEAFGKWIELTGEKKNIIGTPLKKSGRIGDVPYAH